MNKHKKIKQLLPFYTTGQVSQKEIDLMETHLQNCNSCNKELEEWKLISSSIETQTSPLPSPDLLIDIVGQIDQPQDHTTTDHNIWHILKSQFPLVRQEIWTSSFLILLIGFIITVLVDNANFFYALAPLVSAAGIAFIYNKENDPAFELILSTPTSQVQILLSRLSLVFGYNLILTLLLSFILSLIYSMNEIVPLIINWLAPMTFLSILGLSSSVLISSENAIIATYTVWLGKYLIQLPEFKTHFNTISIYTAKFWDSPQLLFSLSALIMFAIFYYIKNSLGVNHQLK